MNMIRLDMWSLTGASELSGRTTPPCPVTAGLCHRSPVNRTEQKTWTECMLLSHT